MSGRAHKRRRRLLDLPNDQRRAVLEREAAQLAAHERAIERAAWREVDRARASGMPWTPGLGDPPW